MINEPRAVGASLIVLLLLFGGCGKGSLNQSPGPVPAASSPPANSSTIETAPSKIEPQTPAEQTIFHFAELVSKGDVNGAASLLAPGLRGAYEFNNFAPIRNTPRMEIVRLVNRTNTWRPDISAVDPTQVDEAHVFYAEVRYKVLGIIESYVKDGEIYYHRITVLKLKQGGWVISEMSGTRRMN